MAPRPDIKTVLRALAPYPAVFVPTEYGGFEAVFPNFAQGRAHGLNLDLAAQAAREELTALLTLAFLGGTPPPPPSDPDRLAPDDEEIPGTRILMIEPERDLVLKRLGLARKKRLKTAPSGEKYKP
ncbi:MAG: hypothetical protein V1816_07760 [Pseudomonadota bacterium]